MGKFIVCYDKPSLAWRIRLFALDCRFISPLRLLLSGYIWIFEYLCGVQQRGERRDRRDYYTTHQTSIGFVSAGCLLVSVWRWSRLVFCWHYTELTSSRLLFQVISIVQQSDILSESRSPSLFSSVISSGQRVSAVHLNVEKKKRKSNGH